MGLVKFDFLIDQLGEEISQNPFTQAYWKGKKVRLWCSKLGEGDSYFSDPL